MNIARIKETCIYVKDLGKTRHFYTDMLGLEMISLVEGRHIFFKAGQSVLLCFIAAQSSRQKELPPHGASGIIHYAFEVENNYYNTALQKIKDCNIKILYEQEWKGGLRSFYFNDPDGNLLEIIEEGLWE